MNARTLIEMVEEQLSLNEADASYTQNIYKISVKLRVNKARGGDITDIINEIRGIEGVTTVKHEAEYARNTETFDFLLFTLKYELVGSDASPMRYQKAALVPGLRNITGIDIQDIQRNPENLS
jgi:hypothetical protein